MYKLTEQICCLSDDEDWWEKWCGAARLDHGPNCQNSPVSSLFKPVNPCDNQAFNLSFHQVQINNHLNLQSQSSSLIFATLLATCFIRLMASSSFTLCTDMLWILLNGNTTIIPCNLCTLHTICVQFTCTWPCGKLCIHVKPNKCMCKF